MNINAESGVNYFQRQSLPDMVLIYGAEPLLNLEVLDALRKRAKQDDYLERLRLDMPTNSDWFRLINEVEIPSLFSPKRFIELHCDDKKLSKTAENTLLQVAERSLEQVKIVVYAPNLTKIENSKWFKKIFAHENVAVRSFSLYPQAFNKQIDQRLQQAKLKLTAAARERLLAFCQGNLLAAQQAIERLRIHPQHEEIITEALLQTLLSDLSQFKVFALLDAILASHWLEAYKIAGKLAQEANNDATLITWLLQRDMSLLIQLMSLPKPEHNEIYKAFQIPKFQQKRYQVALKYFSMGMARTTLVLAARLDSITKGVEYGNFWLTLQQYLLLRAK